MTSHLLPAVSAASPLPVDEQREHFDVERYLLENPRSSFYIQVEGDSMQDRGIQDGDILVVDKTLQPRQGSVVVAKTDGLLTIKTYDTGAGRLCLVPANSAPLPPEPSEGSPLCGVATFVIHKL